MLSENRRTFTLGVTGGIGSGKTSVCRVFNVLGIPVFSADIRAKAIMNSDERIIKAVNTIAGRDLYKTGTLDRSGLAEMIFNNKSALEKINSLIHPLVLDHFEKWREEQTSAYVIMEAAILFETGAARLCDRSLTVIAPVDERSSRVIVRNRLSRADVMARIRNQMDDISRIKLSDYVISNSENDMIIPAVLEIHAEILDIINTID